MKKLVYGFFLAALLPIFIACNPAAKSGNVTLDFGNGRAASSLPAGISSMTVTITAPDIATLGPLSVDMSSLSLSLEVPAGNARTFTVLASNAAGRVLYTGTKIADIPEGTDVTLSISMNQTDVPVTGIAFSSSPIVGVGGTVQLAPVFTPSNATDVSISSWTSDNPDVVSVNTTGLATGVALGTATITAVSHDGEYTATCTVYVNPANTVTFNANGGSGEMAALSIVSGLSANLTANTLTYAGYSFSNWNTSSDGTGTSYANGALYTMGADSVTLYAIWTSNPTHTVTFDSNGGSGTMSPLSIAIGASSGLTQNTFTYTGKAFFGWSTSSTGTVEYVDMASYTMGSAGVTLYAIWVDNLVSNYNFSDGSTSWSTSSGSCLISGGMIAYSYSSDTVSQTVSISSTSGVNSYTVYFNTVSAWYGTGSFGVTVTFLNSEGGTVGTLTTSSSSTSSVWTQNSLTLNRSDYSSTFDTITSVTIAVTGCDTIGWAGYYGPRITNVILQPQ